MLAPTEGGGSYRLAQALSVVVNPLILPPIAFLLVLGHVGAGRAEAAAVVGVALVAYGVAPLLVLAWLVRTGRARTLDVPTRQNRLLPLLVGVALASGGALGIALAAETERALVVGIAAIYPLNTLLAALVTLRSKISLHLIGLAGAVSVLLFVAFEPGWNVRGWITPAVLAASALLIPALMWARVRVRAHTPMQTVAGAAFGLALPLVELGLIMRWAG